MDYAVETYNRVGVTCLLAEDYTEDISDIKEEMMAELSKSIPEGVHGYITKQVMPVTRDGVTMIEIRVDWNPAVEHAKQAI